MSVYLNGISVSPPVKDGTSYAALYNGAIVWPDKDDTIVSVSILAPDGAPAPTSLPIDGSIRLAAQATYADGRKSELLTATNDVTFTTTTPDIVSVTGNTVAWKHGGTAVVTATVAGFTGSPLSVTCAWAPESITVTSKDGAPVTSAELRVNGMSTLTVTVQPREADQAVTATVKDPAIATITTGEETR